MSRPPGRTAAALALLVWAGATVAAAQQFRATTGVVRLPVIVTDRSGATVGGLTRESFEVYEDGVRQDLQLFAEGGAGDTLPLRLGLLLDTSGSMELDLKDAMTAVIRFIDACEDATDVTFVDFDRTVQLGRFGPQSYPMLYSRIRSRKPGDTTALYDAMGVYLQGTAGRRGQHVLLLYTDGGDTASSITFTDVQQMLRSSDVLVYVVGYMEHQPSGLRVQQQMQMTRLAHETGGEAFFPESLRAVDQAYERILEQVRSRYTLGYVPSTRPQQGFHRVEVKLSSPDTYPGVKIRTRAGYHVYASDTVR
jgi:Ca-activated chloride channel family protein